MTIKIDDVRDVRVDDDGDHLVIKINGEVEIVLASWLFSDTEIAGLLRQEITRHYGMDDE